MERHVAQLLNDFVEGRLDEAQAADLERMLRTRPDVREAYFKLLGVHLDLAEDVAAVRPFSLAELRAMQAIDDKFGAHAEPPSPQAATPPAPARRRNARLWTIALSLAAAVALAVGLPLLGPPSSKPGQSAGANKAEVVARITKKIDCDWENDRWNVAPSAEITAGQRINLSRGLLVLEFSSGAVVALNGPATLIPTSPLRAQLIDGTLSASVPPSGRGFTIETQAGQFIDLGTEFGMVVGDDGAVETHVFKGKVIAEPHSADDGEPSSLTLEGGAAWARSQRGVDGQLTNAQPDRFMLPEIPAQTEDLGAPPVDRDVALWFNAGSRVQLDERNRVSAWGDHASPGNQLREDAWQVLKDKRPLYVEEGLNGRPALRFNGFQGLVTEPVSLGANQTSAVVFRVNPKRAARLVRERREYKHLGVQLLNLNGPPHTVMQINGDVRLEARVHLALLRNRAKPEDTGLLRTQEPISGAPHVAIYTYDSNESRATLYLDGQRVSQSEDAPLVSSTSSPRYIGAHFDRRGFGFTGEIAEVIVYDTALSHDESVAVSSWLASRYEIPTKPPTGTADTAAPQE